MGVIGCFDKKNSYKISDVLIYCQEKLPTPKRRPVPQAPENFDKVTSHRGNIVSLYLWSKVISGEMRGKDLVKMNQKAFDDYNDTALMSCPWCSRSDTLHGSLSIIYVGYVARYQKTY